VDSREEARPFYVPAWYYALPEEKAVTPDNTFVGGEGMIVVLENGTRFEDWEGQSLVSNIGLGRADMARALAEQALRLSWLAPSLFADVRVALTKDLQSVLPQGISVPFYGIGGADSIEAAVRAARKVTRRKNVLAFTGGFHGDTITTESVSGWGVPEYGDPRPWTVHVPSPYDWFQDLRDWDRAYERCLEGIEKALKKRGPRTFASILVEPVTGMGGAVPLSEGLSKALRELCDRHGIKLIADEVVTGFGRTGEWFGSTRVGLKPDAMVLAKGITGGYAPLSAAVFERSWGEELRENGFPHGPTFGGHPLGCAAARETIRILKAERLVQQAKTVGAYMKKRLVELGREHPAVVREVRGAGLLLARQLGVARRGRTYGSHPASPRVWTISEGLRSDGMRIWASADGSSVMFCPPFIVTEAQVDRLVDRLDFHLQGIAHKDAMPIGTYSPEAA